MTTENKPYLICRQCGKRFEYELPKKTKSMKYSSRKEKTIVKCIYCGEKHTID